MVDHCSSLDEVRVFQDRPLNIVDVFLFTRCDGIPKDPELYLSTIRNQKIVEDFIKYIDGISLMEVRKIEDLLIEDNILYAIEKSKMYRKKYMSDLNINDYERLRAWIKNNIKTSEDLDLLPPLTNEDMRRPGLDYNAWWIPGRRIASTYQSGGSTGKPSIIPYSPIDKTVACLANSAMVRKYISIKEWSNILMLGPGDPHPLGPLFAYCFELMGIATTMFWKHFKNTSSEAILSMISELHPDILISAPHGPKGATAALDVLLATDQQNGTEILPTCLKGKTIISGGAPMARSLCEELYNNISVSSMLNGYGSAQTGGTCADISGEFKEGDPDFSSKIEIPSGYWSVNPISDEEAPESWSRFGISVLGREIMPIINYEPGDYGQVDVKKGRIDHICRIEWFYKDIKTGRCGVKIPSQVTTCISGV